MNYIAEVPLNRDSYDEETLSIVCPECSAAITARCLGPKPGGMGGQMWLPAPHRSRVLKAHHNKQEDI